MDRLRRVPFVLAMLAMGLVVCIELGSSLLRPPPPEPRTLALDLERERLRSAGPLTELERAQLRVEAEAQAAEIVEARRAEPARPGLGIPYLAFIDGLLLFLVLMMGVSLVLPERLWGRAHGWVRLVAMAATLLAAMVLLTLALALLLLMFGLFVAAPFGTIAYLALWGSFDRGGAQVTLGLLLALKVGFAVLLIAAQQRYLAHKGLVLLVLTSLLGNAVVAFLHALVPGILVSITDALAALIVGVLGALWAAVMLVGAVVTIIKSLRLEATEASNHAL